MTEPAPDAFTRELAELRSYLAGLGSVFQELEQQAPARSTGTDATGTIRVTLDHAGQPEQITVHDSWPQRLRPDALSAATAEAFSAAATARGAAWKDALDRAGWQQRADRLDDRAGPAVTAPGELPAAFRRVPPGPPRPVSQLAEDVLTGLDSAAALAARPRPASQGTGANRERTVTVTLRPGGQLACEISAQWAAPRTAAALNDALAQALTAARRSLAAAAALGKPDMTRANQLLAEALDAFGRQD